MNSRNDFAVTDLGSFFESLNSDHYNETVSIQYNNIIIDLFQDLKTFPKGLIVFLPSAQPRDLLPRVPYFPRLSWKNEFENYDFLVLSDPILRQSSHIHSSWFLDWDNDILSEVSSFLTRFISNRSYEEENVLFYGSSMGGFAALHLASLIEGTKAVAEVPQIDMTQFPDSKAIDQVSNLLGGDDALVRFSRKFPERIDVFERFKASRHVPRSLIITNRGDSAFDEHIRLLTLDTSFYKSLDDLSSVSVIVDPIQSGHTVLQRSYISELILNFMDAPNRKVRIRGIDTGGEEAPLFEPLWTEPLIFPFRGSTEVTWIKADELENSITIDLRVENQDQDEHKGLVVALDISGLSNQRQSDLGLHYSPYKSIGYFKYISLVHGANDITIKIKLNHNEKLHGIGLLNWDSKTTVYEKLELSNV